MRIAKKKQKSYGSKILSKTKKENSLASNLSIVESTARNCLVNERKILNNTERFYRQNPSTRRELDRT